MARSRKIQSNGMVMRRNAVPDRVIRRNRVSNEYTLYSFIVPDENVIKRVDGKPALSEYDSMMVDVPVKLKSGKISHKLFFPKPSHQQFDVSDGFAKFSGFVKNGSKNGNTLYSMDEATLKKQCDYCQALQESMMMYEDSVKQVPVKGKDGAVRTMQTTHTEQVQPREAVDAYAKKQAEKAEFEVKGNTQGYRQYKAVEVAVLQDEAAELLDKSNVMVLNGYIQDYNKCCEFADQHDCNVKFESPSFDVDNLTDYASAGDEMHYIMNDAYSKLEKECLAREDLDISMLPLVGDYSSLRRQVGSKVLTPAEETDLFNQKRGLSVYDDKGHVITRNNDNFKYQASFNRYALSDREMQQLEAGETIVLSEVASADNKSSKNYMVKLEQRTKPDSNGLTYYVKPVGDCDTLSDFFKDMNHNEKYYMEYEQYAALGTVINTHSVSYNSYVKDKVKNLDKKITDAQAVSHERHSMAKGTRTYTNTVNYTVDYFYDSGRKQDTVIKKRRKPALIDETRDRLIQQEPSSAGLKKGFTNMYDEVYYKQHLQQQKSMMQRLESAFAYGRENPQATLDMTELERLHNEFAVSGEYMNREIEMRKQPVSNAEYANMGFANQWEVYVYEKYNEMQKSDERNQERHIVDGHYNRLQGAMHARGRALPSVAEFMDVENNDYDYGD